jgi:WD40 repeat protein
MLRLCLVAAVLQSCLGTPWASAQQRKDRHGDPLPEGALARIGTLRFRVGADAHALAYSPNGKYLAVGGASFVSESPLVIFDAATGVIVERWSGHAHIVRTVAYSADGQLLAAGGGDDRLSVWDTAKGKRLWLSKTGIGFGCVTFVGDKKIVTADEGAGIRLLDAVTGKPGLLLEGHEQRVLGIAAAPDGKRLASCAMDGSVRLWDPSSGKELARFAIADKYGVTVAFSRDGQRLVCGTYTGAIYMYDVAAAKERWQTPAGETVASSLAFSADGSELITIRADVRVLDAGTGKERRRLALPQEMSRLALSPDGKTLAVTMGRDGEVRQFNLQTGEAVHSMEGHARPVLHVAFAPDGKSLATASAEARFRVWDVSTGRSLAEFKGRAGSVAFAPDGRTLATSAEWDEVRMWDVATQKARTLIRPLSIPTNGRIAFLRGEPPLVVCDVNGTLAVWHAGTGKLLPHAFQAQIDLVTSSTNHLLPFAAAADGKSIAVNGKLRSDGPIVLWDPRTGKEIARTTVHGSALALSADGRWLAVRTQDGVALVDTRSNKEKLRLLGSLQVTDAAFAPDGSMLATASSDGSVRLWEIASGRKRCSFAGHRQAVRCVQFSHDGSRLASGSDDGTVLIWAVYRR